MPTQRSHPFERPQCHYDRVPSHLFHRSIGLAVLLLAVAGSCSGDSNPASGPGTSPTVSLAVAERGDEVRDFGVWPTDPALLSGDDPAVWAIEVVGLMPHDPDSYTQGLELAGDVFVESRGRYSESEIRLVDPASGEVTASAALDSGQFGEGATVVGSTIIQLTWREEVALVWSLEDLTLLDQHNYIGEGWGLCAESDRLVMSDGSSTLTFRDPVDFRLIDTIEVTQRGAPVFGLNELECVDGFVLANIFQSDIIVVIEPGSGFVVASIDASRLNLVIDRPIDEGAVLNGIAHWSDDSFVLGGKWWPEMAEVRLVDQ